jgi:hypothetical protein
VRDGKLLSRTLERLAWITGDRDVSRDRSAANAWGKGSRSGSKIRTASAVSAPPFRIMFVKVEAQMALSGQLDPGCFIE